MPYFVVGPVYVFVPRHVDGTEYKEATQGGDAESFLSEMKAHPRTNSDGLIQEYAMVKVQSIHDVNEIRANGLLHSDIKSGRFSAHGKRKAVDTTDDTKSCASSTRAEEKPEDVAWCLDRLDRIRNEIAATVATVTAPTTKDGSFTKEKITLYQGALFCNKSGWVWASFESYIALSTHKSSSISHAIPNDVEQSMDSFCQFYSAFLSYSNHINNHLSCLPRELTHHRKFEIEIMIPESQKNYIKLKDKMLKSYDLTDPRHQRLLNILKLLNYRRLMSRRANVNVEWKWTWKDTDRYMHYMERHLTWVLEQEKMKNVKRTKTSGGSDLLYYNKPRLLMNFARLSKTDHLAHLEKHSTIVIQARAQRLKKAPTKTLPDPHDSSKFYEYQEIRGEVMLSVSDEDREHNVLEFFTKTHPRTGSVAVTHLCWILQWLSTRLRPDQHVRIILQEKLALGLSLIAKQLQGKNNDAIYDILLKYNGENRDLILDGIRILQQHMFTHRLEIAER